MANASSLEIREVGPEQFDEIWPIFEEVARAGDTYPYPMDVSKEEARAYWFMPHARVYHGYLDGVPVASRYIVPNKPGLAAHVCNTGVIIDKHYRGKGLGKQMMAFCLQKTKELGFKAIQLNLVVSTNTASIKICQKNGFEIVGTLPGAFFHKEERYVDAYVMYKTL